MHRHIKHCLDSGEVDFSALVDPEPKNIAALKEAFPAIKDAPEFSDYKDALNNVELDAVLIASPHTLHFQQAMDCLEKGLHCLIEKPMVCSVSDAKTLIAEAEKRNRIICLAYQRHYQPAYRYIKQVVDSGELGEVTYVSALQCQNWKKATSGTWRQIPELSGGGQLNDSGSHLIDIILWTTGLEPKEVTGYIDNCETPVDINSALCIIFKNGAQGTISIVGDAPCWHEDFTIWGTEGAIFYRNGQLKHVKIDGHEHIPEILPETSNPDQNFVDAILRGAEILAPPICGLRTIELTEAAWKAAAQCAPCAVASL